MTGLRGEGDGVSEGEGEGSSGVRVRGSQPHDQRLHSHAICA